MPINKCVLRFNSIYIVKKDEIKDNASYCIIPFAKCNLISRVVFVHNSQEFASDTNFIPVFNPANINISEMLNEIIHAHPEMSAIIIVFDFRINTFPDLISPETTVITPFAIPKKGFAPVISQIDKFMTKYFYHSDDWIGMCF